MKTAKGHRSDALLTDLLVMGRCLGCHHLGPIRLGLCSTCTEFASLVSALLVMKEWATAQIEQTRACGRRVA